VPKTQGEGGKITKGTTCAPYVEKEKRPRLSSLVGERSQSEGPSRRSRPMKKKEIETKNNGGGRRDGICPHRIVAGVGRERS